MDRVTYFLNEEDVNLDHPMKDLYELVAKTNDITNVGMSLEVQILNHVRIKDKRSVLWHCYVMLYIHCICWK